MVQIEAVGTFEDPAEGLQLNAAGAQASSSTSPAWRLPTTTWSPVAGLYRAFVDGYDEPPQRARPGRLRVRGPGRGSTFRAKAFRTWPGTTARCASGWTSTRWASPWATRNSP
ncbi:MAG: hypothetical protein R2838_00805 [Caldilineaceae bacterium]